MTLLSRQTNGRPLLMTFSMNLLNNINKQAKIPNSFCPNSYDFIQKIDMLAFSHLQQYERCQYKSQTQLFQMNNLSNKLNEGSGDEERTQSVPYRQNRTEKRNACVGSKNSQVQQYSNHKRMPLNPNKSKKKAIQNQHEMNNHNFYIDIQEETHHATSQIQNKLLNDVQILNYEESYKVLKQRFKNIVKGHVTFNDVFPKGVTKVGKELLKNGLFHEMWGKVCKKDHKSIQKSQYYQLYYPQLTSNHSNFQMAFNQEDSGSYCFTTPNVASQEDDSNTRLTKRQQNNSKKYVPLFPSFVQNSQNSKDESIKQQQQRIFSGRLRLIDRIQTNQRRLNAEMVCFFLGVKQYYNIVDIHIESIEEFYHTEGHELLIVKAHLPAYNQAVEKVVVDYKPRTLVAMYGFVNFPMLLRIKKQYVKIDGFILYDQLLNLPLWLANNGYSIPNQ